MRVVGAAIRGFRNIAAAELAFSPRVNLFLGGNGQGKSNLFEALNYMSLGRSHRGARDDELIGFETEAARVGLQLETDEGGARSEYELHLGRGSRRLLLDGQPVARRSDLVGRLLSVVCEPGTVELIAGGPSERRRFADLTLCYLDRAYLEHLQAYQRALRQKGSLLQAARLRGGAAGSARRELAAWNQELARHAAPLLAGRSWLAGAATPLAGEIYRTISGGTQSLEMVYKANLESGRQPPVGIEMEREIAAEFDYIWENEVRKGRPVAGPHLDDYEILLAGINLRVYGSEGEARSAAISLKLAQGELVYQQRRLRPILFFDDIFSELDRERTCRLQEWCSAEHQLLIATARGEDVLGWRPPGTRCWNVQGGRIEDVS